MTAAQLIPAIIVPLFAWRVYRRFRRNVGRQHFHPRRLITTVVIFSVITVLIASYTWPNQNALLALGGGVAIGVALAFVGLHLTKFEKAPDDVYYTPNTAIGVALTVLLVGRIVYRIAILAMAPPADQYVPPMFQSRLTLAVYGLTVGYYIAYSAAVLTRGRHLAAAG